MTRRARPISNICAGPRVLFAPIAAIRRALSVPEPVVGRAALPGLQKEHLADRGNGHAVEPHTAVDMVLGRLSADDADAGHVGPAIPAAVGSVALRDGVHAASQAPRWHGEARARHNRGEHPVEIDECLVGGKTRGEGRGVHHKVTVVGAVEVRACAATIRMALIALFC